MILWGPRRARPGWGPEWSSHPRDPHASVRTLGHAVNHSAAHQSAFFSTTGAGAKRAKPSLQAILGHAAAPCFQRGHGAADRLGALHAGPRPPADAYWVRSPESRLKEHLPQHSRPPVSAGPMARKEAAVPAPSAGCALLGWLGAARLEWELVVERRLRVSAGGADASEGHYKGRGDGQGRAWGA
jgi:hypothetical protein